MIIASDPGTVTGIDGVAFETYHVVLSPEAPLGFVLVGSESRKVFTPSPAHGSPPSPAWLEHFTAWFRRKLDGKATCKCYRCKGRRSLSAEAAT